MSKTIHIGDKGTSIGPLKPAGQINIDGQKIDAISKGEWINANTEVVIIGGSNDCVIVRENSANLQPPKDIGTPLVEKVETESIPLQFPPAIVERVNTVVIGLIIGALLIPALWFVGLPFQPAALLLPLSGAVTGWLVQKFVGTASPLVGPREDHRPRANLVAIILLLICLGSSVVVFNLGFGFLGLGLTMPLSTLVGGLLYIGVTLLQHM